MCIPTSTWRTFCPRRSLGEVQVHIRKATSLFEDAISESAQSRQCLAHTMPHAPTHGYEPGIQDEREKQRPNQNLGICEEKASHRRLREASAMLLLFRALYGNRLRSGFLRRSVLVFRARLKSSRQADFDGRDTVCFRTSRWWRVVTLSSCPSPPWRLGS